MPANKPTDEEALKTTIYPNVEKLIYSYYFTL